MGFGSYSAASYKATTGAKVAAGTTFSYDRTVRSTGSYKAHDLLDPKKLNAAGKNLRESRDRDGQDALPVVVGLDMTGSMSRTPRIVQQKLTGLFGLLLRKGYAGDQNPQIMISAYGDAYTDNVPLQISQFESDNRVDTVLDNLYLEGNGGGNGFETASLLWYYMNKHAATDAWEKRGKKGYFFMVADEIAGDLTPGQIEKFIGADETPRAEDLTAAKIAAELKEKWEVIVLLIDNASAHWQGSKKFYSDLFGENNVIILENDETVSETIGAVIGRLESDDLDDDELIDDLISEGSTKELADRTAKAVSKLRNAPTGSVAKTTMKVDTTDSGVTFL
jgi:hypothetical protein